MTTMLQLVQTISDELTLSRPSYVVGNAQQDPITILSLLNRQGKDLVEVAGYDWQILKKEYRFTTSFYSLAGTVSSGSAVVSGISSTTGLDTTYMVTGSGIPQDTYILSVDSTTQVTLSQNATASGTPTLTFGQTKYTMPSDYHHLVDRTQWDKSKHWEMLGPESSQQWQWLKSGYISTGPRVRFRVMGGVFQIWPILGTNEYLGFEYVSNQWVTSSLSVAQSSFLADTDTSIFPDHLLILGTKLKYFELKGFDTTALYRDYTRALDIAKSNDTGSPTLSYAPRPSSILVGWENIPDSNYGT